METLPPTNPIFTPGTPPDTEKNPYPPLERSLEIARGNGMSKAKIFEAKYEAKLEFPEGGRVQNIKPSMEGVWIFSVTAYSWTTTVIGVMKKQYSFIQDI